MFRLFLIPIILKISKINAGVLFSTGVSQGKGPEAPRIPKWEIFEHRCNTIKIVLYHFLIIFYKHLFKIKKLFKKDLES